MYVIVVTLQKLTRGKIKNNWNEDENWATHNL